MQYCGLKCSTTSFIIIIARGQKPKGAHDRGCIKTEVNDMSNAQMVEFLEVLARLIEAKATTTDEAAAIVRSAKPKA